MNFHLVCFLVCNLIYCCQCSFKVPDDIAVPLQELADKGSDRYYSSDWAGTIEYFEKSLIHYRLRGYVNSACHIKCRNQSISHQMKLNFTGFDDMRYVANIIVQANCIKLCKEEHPYAAVAMDFLDKKILIDFERRKAYNFLQYAYYKVNRLKRACQAALTYYHANLEDEQAINNLEFYRGHDKVEDNYFDDLEAPKFHSIFREAVNNYEEGRYETAILKLELTLAEFFKSSDECQALCFKPIEQINFYRFYKATAVHILDALNCTLNCEKDLSPISFGKKLDNFVALYYSYLQFSYYSTNNLTMAIPAAASVLLFQPSDELAIKNMAYYKQQMDSTIKHFQARQDARAYVAKLKSLKNLVDKRSIIVGEPDQSDVVDDVSDDDATLPSISALVDEITTKLDEKLQSQLNEML